MSRDAELLSTNPPQLARTCPNLLELAQNFPLEISKSNELLRFVDHWLFFPFIFKKPFLHFDSWKNFDWIDFVKRRWFPLPFCSSDPYLVSREHSSRPSQGLLICPKTLQHDPTCPNFPRCAKGPWWRNRGIWRTAHLLMALERLVRVNKNSVSEYVQMCQYNSENLCHV